MRTNICLYPKIVLSDSIRFLFYRLTVAIGVIQLACMSALGGTSTVDNAFCENIQSRRRLAVFLRCFGLATRWLAFETRKPSYRQISARQLCVYEGLFLPSHRCLTPPNWGMPCDINAMHRWKIHLVDYNSVADNRVYLHSFSCYSLRNTRNVAKFQENLTLKHFKVIQGHRSWCKWKTHTWLPISH